MRGLFPGFFIIPGLIGVYKGAGRPSHPPGQEDPLTHRGMRDIHPPGMRDIHPPGQDGYIPTGAGRVYPTLVYMPVYHPGIYHPCTPLGRYPPCYTPRTHCRTCPVLGPYVHRPGVRKYTFSRGVKEGWEGYRNLSERVKTVKTVNNVRLPPVLPGVLTKSVKYDGF